MPELWLAHAGARSCTAAAVLYWDRLLTSGRESTAFYAEFIPDPVEPVSAQELAPGLSKPAVTNALDRPAKAQSPSWCSMSVSERQTWVEDLIGRVVTQAIGKEVAGSQPLMMAGLDSLGKPSL